MKISILSAAQNEEAHIAQMIESVISQTHADFELLIVDDRSTDQTAAIAARYAAQDARVRLVDSQGVEGKNAAWNRAFEVSTGDAVMYMGADDWLPKRSLEDRSEPLSHLNAREHRAATYAKIRMFSDDPRFDGLVYPRGRRGSRVGGTLMMSRAIATEVFPLDATLPNEDLWGATVVRMKADDVFEVPVIVYNYRIHQGNSFHLGQDFASANAALHARNLVYDRLLNTDRFGWTASQREELATRSQLEEMRFRGRLTAILLSRGVDLKSKLRSLVQASPRLYAIRQRFYSTFSGW